MTWAWRKAVLPFLTLAASAMRPPPPSFVEAARAASRPTLPPPPPQQPPLINALDVLIDNMEIALDAGRADAASAGRPAPPIFNAIKTFFKAVKYAIKVIKAILKELMVPSGIDYSTTDPADAKYLWMAPYQTPWNDPQFADNWNSWKTQVFTTHQMRKPDEEYRSQFVPGIGSLRPFVKPARAIPPTELLWAFAPGVLGASMGTTGGFFGFLLSAWACYTTGKCGPDAPSLIDPTSGFGGEPDRLMQKHKEEAKRPKPPREQTPG